MVSYYTVNEFSNLTGKDPGNIRRMLINGTLSGEKVGRQWLIPKDTTLPADKRLRSGKYRKWRQKVMLNQHNPELMHSLKEMCIKLSETYGATLDSIVLYGSYARGEETPESDVDIAVILKVGNTEEMHDKMVDIVVDYESAIKKLLEKNENGYCNYYSVWIFCGPQYPIFPPIDGKENTTNPNLIEEFINI